MDKATELARCQVEIARCIADQAGPNQEENLGALMGELDWGIEARIIADSDATCYSLNQGDVMSWSVSAIGKASSVKAKLDKEIEDLLKHLPKPENSVAEAAKVLLDATLDAQVPDAAVKASACGSQSQFYGQGSDRITNSVKVEVEPVPGFVE